MIEDWQHGGFGLYIHWPFCEAKCPYCDFNSHVARQINHKAWADAYLAELKRVAAETPGRTLRSVFFGGGTPSLMAPETVADMIEAVQSHWPTVNDLEVTLEANPSSVEAGRFAAFRQAGVNRISMGIQAMNDQDLRRLGRLHTVAEARDAFDIARQQFDRVSFDLIYGRQDQTLEAWKAELREALCMAVDHISLYQLTIEAGTAFGDRYARGKLFGLPDEDLGADMFIATQDICAEHGLLAYEVSNHAKESAQSRHNLVYWRYGDYLGIGPGAHGRLTLNGMRMATVAKSHPTQWLDGISTGRSVETRATLDQADQATEFLLMGLRLVSGVSMARFEQISGRSLSQEAIDHLIEVGMVEIQGDNLAVTDTGMRVLNAVIEALIPEC